MRILSDFPYECVIFSDSAISEVVITKNDKHKWHIFYSVLFRDNLNISAKCDNGIHKLLMSHRANKKLPSTNDGQRTTHTYTIGCC